MERHHTVASPQAPSVIDVIAHQYSDSLGSLPFLCTPTHTYGLSPFRSLALSDVFPTLVHVDALASPPTRIHYGKVISAKRHDRRTTLRKIVEMTAPLLLASQFPLALRNDERYQVMVMAAKGHM